jgi:hypothetical protein
VSTWYSLARHNALEELCALRDKSQREGNILPTISTRLQSYTAGDEEIARVHSGAVITAVGSIDDINFTHLRGCAGHLLEDAANAGSFYIALSATLSTVKRSTDLRWCDLKEGEPVEVLWEGTWYQASVVPFQEQFSTLQASVRVRYDGFVESDAYEVIEKGEKDTWKSRVRAPLPALHLYGLRPLEIRGGEGNGILVEEGRKFKDHGNVRDKLDVLRAVIEAVDEPPNIAQSLARLEMRRALARPLKDEHMWGHRTAAAAAACESGDSNVESGDSNSNSNINDCQHDAISSVKFDVEAIQGPPGTGKR